MLTVVCLNWHNYRGRGDVWVTKLRNMVERNLTIPHAFVEVTERDLPPGRIGWFNKLSLLEMFDGDVLYLDLDIVITANINHVVERLYENRSLIWARDDWSYSIVNPRSGREATINSSVMLWSGRQDMSGVTDEMLLKTHGDQGIISQLFWPHRIGLLPEESIQSYRYGLLMRDEPPAPIVVFHGEPKPDLCWDEFVLEHWL